MVLEQYKHTDCFKGEDELAREIARLLEIWSQAQSDSIPDKIQPHEEEAYEQMEQYTDMLEDYVLKHQNCSVFRFSKLQNRKIFSGSHMATKVQNVRLKDMQKNACAMTFRNGAFAFIQDPPIQINPRPEWLQVHYIDANYEYNAKNWSCDEDCKLEHVHAPRVMKSMIDDVFTHGDAEKKDHFLEQV